MSSQAMKYFCIHVCQALLSHKNVCTVFSFGYSIVFSVFMYFIYRQVSNIRRTLVGNKIVDHSDAGGASPVGAAPTTSSFST